MMEHNEREDEESEEEDNEKINPEIGNVSLSTETSDSLFYFEVVDIDKELEKYNLRVDPTAFIGTVTRYIYNKININKKYIEMALEKVKNELLFDADYHKNIRRWVNGEGRINGLIEEQKLLEDYLISMMDIQTFKKIYNLVLSREQCYSLSYAETHSFQYLLEEYKLDPNPTAFLRTIVHEIMYENTKIDKGYILLALEKIERELRNDIEFHKDVRNWRSGEGRVNGLMEEQQRLKNYLDSDGNRNFVKDNICKIWKSWYPIDI